jgi:adenylate kinase family enzyme
MDIVETIRIGNFNRINVVGSPGAGKSTVAKSIADKTGFKLYDLDNYLYENGCKRINESDTLSQINKILLNECFVIDGTYTTTFEHRLHKLDLVVLVDKPTIICIYHFLKRFLLNKNLKCGERITLKTLKLLFTFRIKQKGKLEKLTKDRNITFISCKQNLSI